MLAVNQRSGAVAGFPGLQQQRVAIGAHHRVEREHRFESQRAGPRAVLGRRHQHAFGKNLVVAAWATLMVFEQVDIAVDHAGPAFL